MQDRATAALLQRALDTIRDLKARLDAAEAALTMQRASGIGYIQWPPMGTPFAPITNDQWTLPYQIIAPTPTPWLSGALA